MAGMNWYDDRTAVRVTHYMMAAADSRDCESGAF